MSLTKEEEELLSPNIRRTVLWLRNNGFDTTDSGDGTNFAAGMEDALPGPHVFMVIEDPCVRLIDESIRLYKLVERWLPGHKYVVEASYNPIDGLGILALLEVSDDVLFCNKD